MYAEKAMVLSLASGGLSELRQEGGGVEIDCGKGGLRVAVDGEGGRTTAVRMI